MICKKCMKEFETNISVLADLEICYTCFKKHGGRKMVEKGDLFT